MLPLCRLSDASTRNNNSVSTQCKIKYSNSLICTGKEVFGKHCNCQQCDLEGRQHRFQITVPECILHCSSATTGKCACPVQCTWRTNAKLLLTIVIIETMPKTKKSSTVEISLLLPHLPGFYLVCLDKFSVAETCDNISVLYIYKLCQCTNQKYNCLPFSSSCVSRFGVPTAMCTIVLFRNFTCSAS